MLKIAGIVMLAVLIFLTLIMTCNTKYDIEGIWEKNVLKYNFKVKLLLGMISILGAGKGEKTELSVKILFAKKRLGVNSKKHGSEKAYNTESDSNVLKAVKKIYHYKKFIREIMLIIRPRYVKIEGKYGLEDPYMTGMLGGIFAIIKAVTGKKSVNMKPDFFNGIFNVSVEIRGSLKIIYLIFVVLKGFITGLVKKNFHRKHLLKRHMYKETSEVKIG